MLKHAELRYHILRKFHSQGDFAAQMKTHGPVVSDVLHGRQLLDSESGKRWASALDLELKDLETVIDHAKRPRFI